MSAIGKNRQLRRLGIIASEGRESETYWIYLRPGFHNGSGEHAIAADTKSEARSRLSDVEPCECEECLNPRERGDDDGVEYGDPRDSRDEH